jgi:hypothetical protein
MAPTICKGYQIINLLQHLGCTSIAGLFHLDIFYRYRLRDIRDPFCIFLCFSNFYHCLRRSRKTVDQESTELKVVAVVVVVMMQEKMGAECCRC